MISGGIIVLAVLVSYLLTEIKILREYEANRELDMPEPPDYPPAMTRRTPRGVARNSPANTLLGSFVPIR